jgi:putative transcriptional regulator
VHLQFPPVRLSELPERFAIPGPDPGDQIGCRADALASQDDGTPDEATIAVHLDEMLRQRGMTLTELSARVDITIVNLSVLKNGRARAIRFSTMARLCEALHCQPGDLLSYQPPAPRRTGAGCRPAVVG